MTVVWPLTELDTPGTDTWMERFPHRGPSAGVGMGIKFCGITEDSIAKLPYRMKEDFMEEVTCEKGLDGRRGVYKAKEG